MNHRNFLLVTLDELTLNNHVDASVIGAKSVRGDASEEGAVRPLGPPDAQVRYYPTDQNLFANGVTGVGFWFETLVVHVPDDSNWLL